MLFKQLRLSHLLWLALALLIPASITYWEEEVAEENIIYEYQIITQKKGELLSDAIKYGHLDPTVSELLNELPIRRTAPDEREFRLAYSIENGERFVSEVQMSYGNRMANFVLNEDEDGDYHFVSQPSQISDDALFEAIDGSLDVVSDDNDGVISVDIQEPENFEIPDDPDGDDKIPLAKLYPINYDPNNPDDAPVDTSSESIINEPFSDIPADQIISSNEDIFAADPSSSELTQVIDTNEEIPVAIVYPVDANDKPNNIANEKPDGAEEIPLATTFPVDTDDQPNSVEEIPLATTIPVEKNDKPSGEVVAQKPKKTKKKSPRTILKDETVYALSTTQSKGQDLNTALKPLRLTAEHLAMINDAGFTRKSRNERTLTAYFTGARSKKLLRGFKVINGKLTATYVLAKKNGKFFLRSVKFVDSADKKLAMRKFSRARVTSYRQKVAKKVATDTPNNVATSSKSNKPVGILRANESLFARRVTQVAGQSLSSALRPLQLSREHQKLISSAGFIKKARSTRTITVYFTGAKNNKLLRGFNISSSKSKATYVLAKRKGTFYLRSLKFVDSGLRKLAISKFKKATTVSYANTRQEKSKKRTVAKTKSKAKTKATKSKTTKSKSRGNFKLVRATQKKGQSISRALRKASLSKAQRRLLNDLPIASTAKSTRTFHLLFERRGASKYLRGVRVTRAGRAYEYALTKYAGRWVWTDRNGKVKISSKSKSRRRSGGFLRYPLNFRRVSSGFNLRRRHPITRRRRPHKGTDFSAPHGTPIWAPADGVVTFTGRQRGYGITLIINHGGGYKTKYAHLSRIMPSARRGKRVRKRQIIARVGNTGISTGAHLHYEVLVNGRARNPMTVRLPSGGSKSSRMSTKTKTKTLSSAKRDAAKYLPKIRRLL